MKARSFLLMVVVVIFLMAIVIGAVYGRWLYWLFVPLVGYYIISLLATVNFIWTRVRSGWCKIRLFQGKFDGIIKPGLRLLGLPGIHTLYKRKMTFFKSVTDKDGVPQAELHEDEDISSFKTTDYAYAFPFKDEEDSHALPLSGILAVNGLIVDYEKAFFQASDWYASTGLEIMPCFRGVLAEVSYDDDIVGRDKKEEKDLQPFSDRLWEKLSLKKNGKLSILENLLTLYGVNIKSVYLRTIDPPDGWRDTTLAPYKAQKDKEAAVHEAAASAARFDDTNQALKAWLMDHNATPAQIQEKRGALEVLKTWLTDNPNATPEQILEKQKEVEALNAWLTGHFTVTQTDIKAKQKELEERAKLKYANYQGLRIEGLENAGTAVVGGGGTGGAGIFVGNSGNGGNQGQGGKKNVPPRTGPGIF